jgi:hypothetical protein
VFRLSSATWFLSRVNGRNGDRRFRHKRGYPLPSAFIRKKKLGVTFTKQL